MRGSPPRGEAREDRSGPSERKGEQHRRRGAPPSERYGLGAMKLLAVEGERARSFSRRAENEGGAEALPPPRFKPNFGSCLTYMLLA